MDLSERLAPDDGIWVCGACGKTAVEYTLIADWIYHTTCWNKELEENPP